MYCWNCGKEIDDDSKFCQFCGANLNQTSSKNVNTDSNNHNANMSAASNANNTNQKIALPKKYCYFNWGAWSLCWIYPFCNRMAGWGFFIIVMAIITSYFIHYYPDSAFSWIGFII